MDKENEGSKEKDLSNEDKSKETTPPAEGSSEGDKSKEGEGSGEVDYKALADSNAALAAAEKARADAAEALIIKNKSASKRKEDETTTTLSEERVKELIREAKGENDDSPEAKALTDAQATVKRLEAEKAELIRSAKSKNNASNDGSSTHHDGIPKIEPKLPSNSPLNGFKHLGNGIYSKKLKSGKMMYRNLHAQGNERKTWVE